MIAEKRQIGTEPYSHYSNAILLKAYSKGPMRLKRAIAGLNDDDLKAKPIEGKWSIAEIVIHLAEGEIIGACRFRQAYTNHPAPFPYYLEAEWALKMKYQNQPISFVRANLHQFILLRKTTMHLLGRLTEEDWQKTGIHPQRGTMSIRGLLELYADHSERHIEQILHRRKLLGKPISMRLILKDRLY
jgi:hypothetical protein